MNSALFSNPANGDDIDPAIYADVARLVQDLLGMHDLQQPPLPQQSSPLQSFVQDETSNNSRKVMATSDFIVPFLNIKDSKPDRLDDPAACEIKDLLPSPSTTITITNALPSSLEPSCTHSPSSSSSISTLPHLISAPSGSQLDLKASLLSSQVPSSNTAVATETQDNGSEPVQITPEPEPESAPVLVVVTTAPVNEPSSPIISVVATDPPKSPTVSNATTTKDQEEIKSAAQPTSNAVVPRPMPAPPTRAARKKALLIGINYFGDPNQLLGCINDTRELFGFISGYFGFMYHDTIMLTDDSIYEDKRPTGANIRYWMKWLIKDAQPQDSLFFHYAGHGGRIKDFSYNGSSEHLGDEADGFDEIIYPCDYLRSGIISDDEMYDLMVKDLPAGVQLTALVDACHSGTMLDLPYVYNGDHVTALEKISMPRKKMGAMAAMSADESTNIPIPGSISGANVQTTTTTTTTTITTVVGPNGVTQQYTNTNGIMTTSGSLLPPTGIPAIQSKEGANGLAGQSQTIRGVDDTEENSDTDEANMTSTAAPSVSVTENTTSLSVEVAPILVVEEKPSEAPQPIIIVEEKPFEAPQPIIIVEEKPSEAPQPIIIVEEKPSEVPQIMVEEKTPEVTVVQKVETEDEKEERECDELAHKMAMFRETKGNVVMFSGCRDDQASADIRASAKDAAIISSHQKLLAEANAHGTITNWSKPIDNDGHADANAGGYSLPQTYLSPQARGAVSYAWIKSLSLKRDQTYEELLLSMRNFMKQRDLEQVPQLGSGRPMDMRATFRL